jgi:hypothetical protein
MNRRRLFIALAGSLLALPTSASAEVHFTSPSGNIDCYGYDDPVAVNCVIGRARWTVPAPKSCEFDWVPSEAWVSGGKGSIGSCRSGASDAHCWEEHPCTVLQYGRSITLRKRIRCTSRVNGVTCRARKGRGAGFRVSVEAYRIF